MSKKIVFSAALALLSFNSFAQRNDGYIDDVINKPVIKTEKTEPSLAGNVGKIILSRFRAIEVGTLVDNMKQDNVTQRNFLGYFSVSGTLVQIDEDFNPAEALEPYQGGLLAFTIKLTSDKKVLVHASVFELDNVFGESLNDREDSFEPVRNFKVLTFIYDDGVSYRNLKIIGFNLADVDLRIPIVGDSSNRYFAFGVGGGLGFRNESLTNSDGSVTNYGRYFIDSEDLNNGLGFIYSAHAGFDFKDRVLKNGVIQVKAMMEISEFFTSTSLHLVHTRLYAKPEINVTKPLGKKTSLTFGVSANLALKDSYRSWKATNNSSTNSSYTPVDLNGYGRQPFAAKVIINF